MSPEFVQLPPDMAAVPKLPALKPMIAFVAETLPLLMSKEPVPEFPTYNSLEFVQLPPERVTLPMLVATPLM